MSRCGKSVKQEPEDFWHRVGVSLEHVLGDVRSVQQKLVLDENFDQRRQLGHVDLLPALVQLVQGRDAFGAVLFGDGALQLAVVVSLNGKLLFSVGGHGRRWARCVGCQGWGYAHAQSWGALHRQDQSVGVGLDKGPHQVVKLREVLGQAFPL